MTKLSIDVDANSRNRIVAETDKNFFVEAGAGSGKTTMLVNRMVAMVEQGIDIRKINAITFTKAAANEFYDRFQKILSERSNPKYEWKDEGKAGQLPEPTEITRQRDNEALQNIDLCFMGTIDSFCNMIISEHPTEAGVLSDARLMTESEAKDIYKQEYVNICKNEDNSELKNLVLGFNSVNKNPEEVFVAGMSRLMENRDVHFNYTKTKFSDIDKRVAKIHNKINAEIKILLEHPEYKYHSKEQNNLKPWKELPNTAEKLSKNWSQNFNEVLDTLKKLKNLKLKNPVEQYAVNFNKSFWKVHESKGQFAWTEIFIDDQIVQLKNIQYDVTMTFLAECVPILEKVLRDRGCMRYFDYLYYLRNMLKSDAEKDGKLIKYIADRHSYFLIDEFQDTNPIQAEIFFYLAAENPVRNWYDCVPKKGSLFIVGDPKQSIYRFNSADVTSFFRVKRVFEKNAGDILSLSRNFRSTKVLCQYFNETFSKMLAEETDTQSKFTEIPLPEADSKNFTGIFSYSCYKDKKRPEESDTKKVAGIIKKIVGNPKYVILENKAYRKIKYSDFMIITETKTPISRYIECFDSENIPVKVEGKVPFDSCSSLKEIYNLYTVVADPNNPIALFSALTGDVIGLSENELEYFRTQGYNIDIISAKSFAEDEKINQTLVGKEFIRLYQLYHQSKNLSPAALYIKIMDEYRIFDYVKPNKLDVVYYVLELLRNAEKSNQISSIKDGSDFLKQLIDNRSGEERCLKFQDEYDAVHIANLHKVKGLEAPIVILSSDLGNEKSADIRIERSETSSEGYIFKISEKIRKKDDTEIYIHIATKEHSQKNEEENECLKDEKLRLVYVAATRARNALIVGQVLKRKKWKYLLDEPQRDIFDELSDDYCVKAADRKSVSAEELYKKAEDDSALNRREAESETFEVKLPSQIHTKSKLTDDDMNESVLEEIPEATKVVSDVHQFPNVLGTMIHRMLELIVTTKGKIDFKIAAQDILNEYGVPEIKGYEDKFEAALVEVAGKFTTDGYAQENGSAADLYSDLMSADEVHCEVPFSYKDNSEETPVIWNGVMDLVYKKDNSWYIVDYKTNLRADDLDTTYSGQLEAYKKAFKELTGETADARIYHIKI